MARYYFDLDEGAQILRDGIGTVCTDDEKAILCGWHILAHCIAEPTQILPWQHAEVHVRREDGAHIAHIGMTIDVETQNPVMQASARPQQPG